MGSGSLRPLISMAVVALLLSMMMYLVTLKQVTETGPIAVARHVRSTLERNLVGDSALTLTATPTRADDDVRRYVLRLRPCARIAADEGAVDRLVRRAVEMTLAELGAQAPPPIVTVVAVLPSGERRATFAHDLTVIDNPPATGKTDVPPAAPPSTAGAPSTADPE